MAIEFKLPELGENIEAGDVVTVLVSVGESISQDQPVVEVETDKATIEVPSSVTGVIQTINVQAGDQIQIGQTILTVEATGEVQAEPAPEPEVEPEEETAVEPPAEPEAPPEPEPEPEASAQVGLIEVKIPEMGENVGSGDVIGVLVSVGDTIEVEQPLLEVETDKATIEIPAASAGVVKEVFIKVGDQVQAQQTILTVEGRLATPKAAPVETAPAKATKAETKAAPTVETPPPAKPESTVPAVAPAAPPAPTAVVSTPGKAAPAPPSVRRLARELGVDINQVPGTGPVGRISIKDVKNYVKQLNLEAKVASSRPAVAPAPVAATALAELELPDFTKWGEVERERMSGVRRATARAMTQAWTHIPHVTHFDKADITELDQLRRRYAKKAEAAGGKLTVTAILLKVVAAALKQFPKVNASVDVKNQEVILKKYYHVGIAVDTDRGLLVPSIRNVDQKSIIELAVELGRSCGQGP